MPKSLYLSLIAATAICSVPAVAQAETAWVGNTVASGRLKKSVAAEVMDEAQRKASCASVDSIAIAALPGKGGNQFNAQGELRIGSVQERWTASLCGSAAAFIVEFTGNGMMGMSFTVRPE